MFSNWIGRGQRHIGCYRRAAALQISLSPHNFPSSTKVQFLLIDSNTSLSLHYRTMLFPRDSAIASIAEAIAETPVVDEDSLQPGTMSAVAAATAFAIAVAAWQHSKKPIRKTATPPLAAANTSSDNNNKNKNNNDGNAPTNESVPSGTKNPRAAQTVDRRITRSVGTQTGELTCSDLVLLFCFQNLTSLLLVNTTHKHRSNPGSIFWPPQLLPWLPCVLWIGCRRRRFRRGMP
jgi:hypothetical protein